jgi:hypothetical protein
VEKILYLDYDGPLHPDNVYLIKGRPTLNTPGLNLFVWAPLVVSALEQYPDVRIVLSTSWVHLKRNYQWAKSWLPEELQKNVIGATWHSSMVKGTLWSHGFNPFNDLTRYQQIHRDSQRRGLLDWIALDNDDEGWPQHKRDHLVHVSDDLGISEPGKVEELIEKLGRL